MDKSSIPNKENISPSEANFLNGRNKTDRSSDKLRILRERNKKKSIPKQEPVINDSLNETIKYLENLWNTKFKLNTSCRESSMPRKTKILESEHEEDYKLGTNANLFSRFRKLKSNNEYSFNEHTEFLETSKNFDNDSIKLRNNNDYSKEKILTPQIEADNYVSNETILKNAAKNIANFDNKLNKSDIHQYREKSPEQQSSKGKELLEAWDFASKKQSCKKLEVNIFDTKKHSTNVSTINTDNNTAFQSLNKKNIKKDIKTIQRNSSNVDYVQRNSSNVDYIQRNSSNLDYKEKYYKAKMTYNTKNYNSRQNSSVYNNSTIPKELDKSANASLGISQITQKTCPINNNEKKSRRGNCNTAKTFINVDKNTVFANHSNNAPNPIKPEKKTTNTNLNYKKNSNMFAKTINNQKNTKSMPKLFNLNETEVSVNEKAPEENKKCKNNIIENNKSSLDNE